MEIVAKIPADNSKAPGYYHSFGMSKKLLSILGNAISFQLTKNAIPQQGQGSF